MASLLPLALALSAVSQAAATTPCLSPDTALEFVDAVVVEGRVSNVQLLVDGVSEIYTEGGLKPAPTRLYRANILITDLLRGAPEAHSFTYEWREGHVASCYDLPVVKGETWVFTLMDSYTDAARKRVTRHSPAAYERVRASGKLRQRMDKPWPINDRPETPND